MKADVLARKGVLRSDSNVEAMSYIAWATEAAALKRRDEYETERAKTFVTHVLDAVEERIVRILGLRIFHQASDPSDSYLPAAALFGRSENFKGAKIEVERWRTEYRREQARLKSTHVIGGVGGNVNEGEDFETSFFAQLDADMSTTEGRTALAQDLDAQEEAMLAANKKRVWDILEMTQEERDNLGVIIAD